MTPENDSSSGAPPADAVTQETEKCPLFSKRREMATQALLWCANHNVLPNIFNLITALSALGYFERVSDSPQLRVPERNESSSAGGEELLTAAKQLEECICAGSDGHRLNLALADKLRKFAPAALERNTGLEKVRWEAKKWNKLNEVDAAMTTPSDPEQPKSEAGDRNELLEVIVDGIAPAREADRLSTEGLAVPPGQEEGEWRIVKSETSGRPLIESPNGLFRFEVAVDDDPEVVVDRINASLRGKEEQLRLARSIFAQLDYNDRLVCENAQNDCPAGVCNCPSCQAKTFARLAAESESAGPNTLIIPQMARELAIRALGRMNPRFDLYRSQDPKFREDDVVFWSEEFEKCLSLRAPTPSSAQEASAEGETIRLVAQEIRELIGQRLDRNCPLPEEEDLEKIITSRLKSHEN